MFRILYYLAVFGLLLGIALGFLGAIHPAFDTLASFRFHLALATIGLALLPLIIGKFKMAFLGVILALPGILFSLDWFNKVRFPEASSNDGATKYSFFHLNLLYRNPYPEKVLGLIREKSPDLVAVNEITKSWKAKLDQLNSDYPYRYECPEWGRHIGGSLILSRFKISTENKFCHEYAALALVEVTIEGKTVSIGSVHLRWPWPASGPKQVNDLKPVLEGIGPDAIIVGDFNSVTWTAQLRKFADYGGLDIIGGMGATWLHEKLPVGLTRYIGFPIDHGLSKGAIKVTSAEVLGEVGSDHLPLLIEFELR